MSLLAQIAIFLAAAVIAIPIFRYFKLGSVLGYLAAGIIIGPACLGLISKIDTTQHVAEFGIVLLMFVIGLELQPSRLWVMRKRVFGIGDPLNLDRRAAALAEAVSIPPEALDLALANWGAGERASSSPTIYQARSGPDGANGSGPRGRRHRW